MLPELRKYANEYRLSVDPSLANKVEKSVKGRCEKCEFTRELYYIPFANGGTGAKACLACTMSIIAYDDFSDESKNEGED